MPAQRICRRRQRQPSCRRGLRALGVAQADAARRHPRARARAGDDGRARAVFQRRPNAAGSPASFEQLVARYPETPSVHYAYGVFLLGEEPDLGIKHLQEELRISRNDNWAMLQLAFEYIKRSEFERAVGGAKPSRATRPSRRLARRCLSRATRPAPSSSSRPAWPSPPTARRCGFSWQRPIRKPAAGRCRARARAQGVRPSGPLGARRAFWDGGPRRAPSRISRGLRHRVRDGAAARASPWRAELRFGHHRTAL
jgi:hypothetical protein